jgi:hypothetical protein
MAYGHKSVDEIVDSTKGAIENQAGIAARYEHIPSATLLDGVYVIRELAHFCTEVRRYHRKIKFGVHSSATGYDYKEASDGSGSAIVFNEMWAYFDGDDYAVMRLGYADYNVGPSAKPTFGVYSRLIRNEKYDKGRRQYHMATTEHLPRAVKNVQKYMKPYTLAERAGLTYDDFRYAVDHQISVPHNMFNKSLSSVWHHSALTSELTALIQSGYTFTDASFHNTVMSLIEAQAARTAMAAKQHHGWYVTVRESNAAQVFDVLSIYDIKRTSLTDVVRSAGTRTYAMDELDAEHPELFGKIAALSMVDKGTLIEDVGMRVADNAFWVLR